MNFRLLAVSAVLASGLAGHVSAQTASCPAPATRVSNVQQLLGGNTLCAARDADRWQEFHSGASSGSLIDWKLGPGHPVDPRETVGSWTAQNGANSSVTHTYDGTSYTWLVCQVGASSYTFVSTGASGTITGATVRAGQVSCN